MSKLIKMGALSFVAVMSFNSQAFSATFNLAVLGDRSIIQTNQDGSVNAKIQYLGDCTGKYLVPKNSPTTLSLQFQGAEGEEGAGCANGKMSITQFAVNPLNMKVGESLTVRVVSVMYYNQVKTGKITRIK